MKTCPWEERVVGFMPKVDAILRIAGKTHDTKNQASADEYYKVNTGLTQK